MSKDRITMILSIVGRGKGKPYIQMLNERGIRFHQQSMGKGTAPSEVMEILGFGSKDKDVILSFAPKGNVDHFLTNYAGSISEQPRYGGLMMVIRLTAINRIAAEIMMHTPTGNTQTEEVSIMEKEQKFNLILISANQGYSDAIMQSARKAGATGGTVIRARLAGVEKLEQVAEDSMEVQEEKEIVSILAPAQKCAAIMSAVNQEYGLRTPAKGTVCSVPVDQVMKI